MPERKPFVGNGCWHCEVGEPITRMSSPAGTFALCLECTGRATGWDAQRFEEVHAPFEDHIRTAFVRGTDSDWKTLGEWLGV